MRKPAIYYKDFFAGILTETDEGEYVLQYEENISKSIKALSIKPL
jgi:serine/threonine-protein kinase HipA